MYCPHCSAYIEDQYAMFCSECGQKLTEDTNKMNMAPKKQSERVGTPKKRIEKIQFDNKNLVIIILSAFFLICAIVWMTTKTKDADNTLINYDTGSVSTQSNACDSEVESIYENGNQNLEDSVNYDIPDEDNTFNRSYEENIMNSAFVQTYIDVYPDDVDYLPSTIDIWDPKAGHVLNLRSGPGSKFDLIDQIEDGNKIITLFRGKKEYDFIYFPNHDKYGWILSKYITTP